MDVFNKNITETAGLLRNRKLGAEELTRMYLERIKKENPKINCYISVCEDEAIKASRRAQRMIDRKEPVSLLCGIPLGIKDNICTKDIKTTCASRMLENFVPPYSSTVVKKLEEAGAVILGKLNLDEFAMGSSSENSFFGPVRNPWNKDFVAGGSSGGSAAAVAASLAHYALGSDTGGSIRQPASFCGVVGLKPTYGLVSRFGLVAFASSLDQIGPLSRDVTDCALVMNVIAGNDPMDSTSVKKDSEDYTKGLNKDIKGLKIGLPKEFFDSGPDHEVKNLILKTVNDLKNNGAEYKEISLPALKHAVAAYYLISSSEASSNLARFDGIRYGYRNPEAKDINNLYKLTRRDGFGKEVKRRILLGTYALCEGYKDKLYKKALKVRRMIYNQFNDAFENFDAIAAPVYPTTAFKIGERINDPLKIYLSDFYTVGVSLAGLPALSVPCDLSQNGLPVGIQLIGKPFSEKLLFRIGRNIEKICGFQGLHQRKCDE